MASGISCSGRHTKCDATEECIDRTALAGTSRTQQLRLGLEVQLQQLLPGILDDITRNHIMPKLPWTDSLILPSLSRSWNQAAQRREGYNARVQSHSTEKLVIVSYETEVRNCIALYSMTSKKYFTLPSITGVDRGIPVACQCVSIDSRVYILGGRENKSLSSPYMALDSVYVLDLVGQGKWQRCANMPQSRDEFGCRILNGKIYVFDGRTHEGTVREALLYDPKVNAWSEMPPTSSFRWGTDVAEVGGELVLQNGTTYNRNHAEAEELLLAPKVVAVGRERVVLHRPDVAEVAVLGGERVVLLSGAAYDWDESESEDYEDIVGDHRVAEALGLQIYCPVRNEWREVESVLRLTKRAKDELVFFASGHFHVMNPRTMYRYDNGTNRWTKVHSFSCAALGATRHLRFHRPSGVFRVDGEVLGTMYWIRAANGTSGTTSLQSRGFRGEKKIIVWERMNRPPIFGRKPAFCGTVQL